MRGVKKENNMEYYLLNLEIRYNDYVYMKGLKVGLRGLHSLGFVSFNLKSYFADTFTTSKGHLEFDTQN